LPRLGGLSSGDLTIAKHYELTMAKYQSSLTRVNHESDIAKRRIDRMTIDDHNHHSIVRMEMLSRNAQEYKVRLEFADTPEEKDELRKTYRERAKNIANDILNPKQDILPRGP
jgi:hypothetical protein